MTLATKTGCFQHSDFGEHTRYDPGTLSAGQIDRLISAAHHAPMASNLRAVSVIIVRDAQRRAQIAETSPGLSAVASASVFACIVVDFAKAAVLLNSESEASWMFESRVGLAAASVDAGMVLSALVRAGLAMGLHCRPIDTQRLDASALMTLLHLPAMSLPVAACCISAGPATSGRKPSLPVETFHHDEHWKGTPTSDQLAIYTKDIQRYWDEN